MLFLIRNHNAALLAVDAAGEICQGPAELSADSGHWESVYLYRHPDSPELGFLIAASGRAITLAGRPAPRRFRPVWLCATARDDRVAFRDPVSGRMFSCGPAGGAVETRAEWILGWEEFELLPAEPTEPILRATTELCRDIVTARRFTDVGVTLLTDASRPCPEDVLEALLLVLDDRRAEDLCRALLRLVPQQGAGWPSRLTREPWFAEACRTLMHRQAPPRRVDETYDFLGAGLDLTSFSQTSPGHRFLRHARRLAKPTRELALLATARDEGIYILEWIAHHRVLGVEHVFLYTNNNTDGSDALLAALDAAGIITWFDNTPGPDAGPLNMQRKAYAHALSVMPQILDFEWTLVLDLDEYVVPAPMWQNDLRPILRAQGAANADSIAFPWQIFFPGQQLTWRDDLIGLRYTRSGGNPLVKSAFRTNRFAFADAHHPHEYRDEIRRWVTADGVVQGDERAVMKTTTHNGVVCHYAIRSLEEFVWKYARGENDGSGVLTEKVFRFNTPDVVTNFLSFHEENSGNDDHRYAAIAPGVRREIDSLLALPGIRAAREHVVACYKAQIGPLVSGSTASVNAHPQLSDEHKERWAALVERWAAQQG
ncbi:glycosyltransferase family 2 protein [Tanticharoenia sakaeratensis]|uniref:Glycosyl transferase family 2 n=1 Tax=Tanticharoenia sakaeratensis NBRC 103193 TaxID=1231623 RepID=A0A0D6MIF6_9PROT|nr:glycosyltransferase family 2 protein [Tanticharoenia sakaeratensis]GAN53063.1 hypothetical protein Tasa_004_128 [Tanticharoenia sakaeratensis NBRC 103193]GBQ19626.1 hypothetical protein AA103193_1095 [Tanticharoenia sakaeratensis NBRC 103193]